MPVRHARSETRAVRLLADEVVLVRTVRQDPTTDLEAARRPYAFTLPCRRGLGFGGLVTRSKALGLAELRQMFFGSRRLPAPNRRTAGRHEGV